MKKKNSKNQNEQNGERLIFLDHLPTWENGRYKGCINWDKSIYCKIKGIYDSINFEFEIISVIREKTYIELKIKYLNEEIIVRADDVLKCKLGKKLKLNSKFYYKYKIGDIVNTNTGQIKIIEQIQMFRSDNSSRKGYKYECLKDGYSDEIFESSLINGHGCSVCSNYRIVKGINDIATTHPHLIKYFVNIEDTYKYSYGNDTKVLMKCPNCGFTKHEYINSLTSTHSNGFVCPACSDGFSYPEKFLYNLLSQLNIEFYTQQMFEWARNIKHTNLKLAGDKKYDFYIPSLNMIIETHGEQHYEKSFSIGKNSSRNLEEEVENDRIKKELALANGIKEENYIVIDCRRAGFKWIKDHILISHLNNIFDLSNIDWRQCGKYASNSLIKTACDLWEDGIKNTTKIGNIIGVNRRTAREYLKEGVELGWCNYDPIEASKVSSSDSGKASGKEVLFIELNKTFYSCAELARQSEELVGVKFLRSCISEVCRGKCKSHKGYHFKFV